MAFPKLYCSAKTTRRQPVMFDWKEDLTGMGSRSFRCDISGLKLYEVNILDTHIEAHCACIRFSRWDELSWVELSRWAGWCSGEPWSCQVTAGRYRWAESSTDWLRYERRIDCRRLCCTGPACTSYHFHARIPELPIPHSTRQLSHDMPTAAKCEVNQ